MSIKLGCAFPGNIMLANPQGRILYQRVKTAPGRYSIDVSGFPKGAYYFTAESNDMRISRKIALR